MSTAVINERVCMKQDRGRDASGVFQGARESLALVVLLAANQFEANQSASQPIIQPANQPARQPASQPASQPARQSEGVMECLVMR